MSTNAWCYLHNGRPGSAGESCICGRNFVAAPTPEAQRLVDECAPFLNDSETPAECIARNRKDAEAVFLYYNDAHRWRYVRDHWDEVGGISFPKGGHHPSWTVPSDPDKLTAFVDERRAAGAEAIHNDHPLRHYDRTCPACNHGVPVHPAPGSEPFERWRKELRACVVQLLYVAHESKSPAECKAHPLYGDVMKLIDGGSSLSLREHLRTCHTGE